MKILTDEDTKFKGLDRYVGLKKRFNQEDINCWYEEIYRQPYSIGFVSQFFKKINPKTLEEAYDNYTLSGILDTDLPRTERGRTKAEIEEMAIEWKERCKSDLPLVDFYDALVLHAVVETCMGMIMERVAQDAYRANGYEISETDGNDDRSCGIDFIARNDENTILVQVKPISYFRKTLKNVGQLQSDRYRVWGEQERGKKKYPGATYAYMIYDPSGNWLKKDGHFNFRFWELIDKYGNPIINIDSSDYQHEKELVKSHDKSTGT